MCTGSDRPALKYLNCYVVEKVASKWKDLGELLGLDYQIINSIERDYPLDGVSCCRVVFKIWFDNTQDASWNQLISALRSPTIQLDSLADELEQMLNIECKIYSNSYSLLQTVHQDSR